MQIDNAEDNESLYQGMTNKQPTGTRGDLKSALETLFQNITISLMAEEYLRPNYSSPYAPARLTKVTFHNNHNIYLYSKSTLWIAYGSALFFTLMAMLIGLLSMLKNNVAYANNFSTVLRVAKIATMDVEVLDEEGDGRQPLPARLARLGCECLYRTWQLRKPLRVLPSKKTRLYRRQLRGCSRSRPVA
jgi:hypothetical protein